MIRTRFASPLALAALLAAPAFAMAQADVSTGTSSTNGAYVAPLEKNAAKQSAAAPSKQSKADATTSSTTSTQADVSSGTMTSNGAHVAPLEKNAAKQHAAAPSKQAKADSATAPCATGKQADVSSGTKTSNGAYVAPLEKNSANQQASADGKAMTSDSTGLSSDCMADGSMKPAKTAKKKSTKTASK